MEKLIMRNPKIKNKYNLTLQSIPKLIILDRSKICEPLFWRNNVINAWCISESLSNESSYWLGIYDENSKYKKKIKVFVDYFDGMCSYNFHKFFDYKEIENENDLVIQEKLLNTVNSLIDKGILGIPK